MELDLNARNPTTDDYMPSPLPYIEYLYGYNDPAFSFNSFPMEANTFTPLPTHL